MDDIGTQGPACGDRPVSTAGSTTPENSPTRDTPIWLDRVSKWYGLVIGINEVSLQIESGIVALLGHNGAGKSTLMKLLTGQLRPSLGSVRIFGRSVRSAAARRRIGYCPDVDAFYEDMTAEQFVYAMVRLAGYTASESRDRTEQALETVGMTEHSGRKLASCSKGMRQRVKLAQAIAHDPDLLILDEPLSGLDPIGRRSFCKLFRELADRGKTLLVSSHVLAEMEQTADQVILIGKGRVLAQGSWDRVFEFLESQPAQVTVRSERSRDLACRLLAFPGVDQLQIVDGDRCIVTTRDPGGLCDHLTTLVVEEGFPIQELTSTSRRADALFSLTSD